MDSHYAFLLTSFCSLMLMIPLTSATDLEVQQLLKRLNKPPVKSIQSPDGDIIDCIRFEDQPAFDDPEIRKHALEMTPSGEPEGQYGENGTVFQVWHETNESCPEGTVVTRRTTEEDVLRARSIHDFGRKIHGGIPHLNTTNNSTKDVNERASNTHEYAVVGVRGNGKQFYGTQTIFSLYQPKTDNDEEFSLAQVWLVAGSDSRKELNTIEAGWQVYPHLYSDARVRLFTFWTRDSYNTGCYNLLCSGFVQTSKKVVVGGTLAPVSVYGGRQRTIKMMVRKEQKSGKWLLKVESETVGYWPSSLFTKLGGREGATEIQWGGEVVNNNKGGKHTTTQMGAGGFPGECPGKASSFKNIQVVDAGNVLKNVKAFDIVRADHPNCYNILHSSSRWFGTYFYYGGPGRNARCP